MPGEPLKCLEFKADICDYLLCPKGTCQSPQLVVVLVLHFFSLLSPLCYVLHLYNFSNSTVLFTPSCHFSSCTSRSFCLFKCLTCVLIGILVSLYQFEKEWTESTYWKRTFWPLCCALWFSIFGKLSGKKTSSLPHPSMAESWETCSFPFCRVKRDVRLLFVRRSWRSDTCSASRSCLSTPSFRVGTQSAFVSSNKFAGAPDTEWWEQILGFNSFKPLKSALPIAAKNLRCLLWVRACSCRP